MGRFSFAEEEVALAVCGISEISLSSNFLKELISGYVDDPFTAQIVKSLASSPSFTSKEGILYFEDSRIVVPKVVKIREALLHDAHDALGHLGPRQTFAALSTSFYWPGMSKSVLSYVSSCDGYRMVSDRDKLFTSKFWRTLHRRVGLHLQMSTAFHPETDGRSECTNKTAIQVLRHYVSRQQKDWVRYLATTEYAINVAVNDSTGATPFELVLGFTPTLSPSSPTEPSSLPAVESLLTDRTSALTTALYSPDTSTVRLALPADDRAHPVFHTSKIKPYAANNADTFPSRHPPRPQPIDVDGELEYEVEAIVDEKGKGQTKRYLVKWVGYPDSDNTWEAAGNVEDTAALLAWQRRS
ncbi:hypothetical protein JCM11641_001275 [Rhodosporidiobolus odoratus]